MDEDFKNQDVEIEDTSYTGVIETPFDPKRIDITTKQMILDAILKRLRYNEVDLNTFFQRGLNLWDNTKQSRLIESILIRLPLPAFYFDGSDDKRWLVVDGLQRLSTFKKFIIDKTLKLENLEYLTQFNDSTFDELPRDLQRRIEEHEITVYIINSGTPAEVKFNLFRRINTGGLVLNAQEIRHALNQGIITDFITELAELPEFKQYEINSSRMLDKDFITRFLAFYIFPVKEYKPDLDSFINKATQIIKYKTKEERDIVKHDFQISMKRVSQIFGKSAFRKMYKIKDNLKSRNKALFEVFSVLFSKLDNNTFEILHKKKSRFIEYYVELLSKSKDFEKSITSSTGDPKNVKFRFYCIQTLIQLTINDNFEDKHFELKIPENLLTLNYDCENYLVEESFIYGTLAFLNTDIKEGNSFPRRWTISKKYPLLISYVDENKLQLLNNLIKTEIFRLKLKNFDLQECFYKSSEQFIEFFKDERIENNVVNTEIENWKQDLDCSVVYNNNNILIIFILDYDYVGGAHGSDSYYYLIFDVETNKKILYKDVFVEGCEEKLTKLVYKSFNNNVELKNAMNEDKIEFNLTTNFYFDNKNVYFRYQPYEIGTYSLGAPVISIPLKEIKPYIKPDSILTRLF